MMRRAVVDGPTDNKEFEQMTTTMQGARRGWRAIATAAVAAMSVLALVSGPSAIADVTSGQPMTADEVLAKDKQALLDTGVLDLHAPQQATVLTPDQFQSTDTNSAIVRLDNDKIAFMVKDASGKEQPFLPMASETGFWDSRSCGGVYEHRSDKLFSCVTAKQSPFYKDGNYEAGMKELFRQMKQDYGLNTVQITVNWAEWDRTTDPNNPKFDFSVMDDLAKWAGEAGLKVFWVLFFHVQVNMPSYETGYRPDGYPADEASQTKKTVYNLADEGNFSYGIQWGNGNDRTVKEYTDAKNDNSATPELYPEYWQPTIHKQLMTALSTIAKHYRDSKEVIGYQVGNEEGVCGGTDYNYRDNLNTANPYYQAMYKLWQEKTGSTNYTQFRKDLGLGVWQTMVAAMRAEDPYKVLTTNFQSSDVDKLGGNISGGQDLNFYRDAGLDLIAPMYYGGTEGIRANVDSYYGSSDHDISAVAQELPGLFPSEIGVSWDRGPNTQSDILDTLARGGIGFGLYSFGEMQALTKDMKKTVKSLLQIFNAYEQNLWSSQPVGAQTTRNLHMASNDANMTLTTLETNNPDVTMGLMWRDYYNGGAGSAATRSVTVTAKQAGTYQVEAMVNANADNASSVAAQTFTVQAGGSFTFDGISMDDYSAAVLKITKVA